ncbi:MAG: hypothetical protein ACYS8Z_13570 [Planctomycetota bacterium]
MIELLEKISQSTSYIAVGGTVALIFLLIFAQSIFGSKTTQSQLKKLIDQGERMNEKLEDIARSIKSDGGKRPEEGHDEAKQEDLGGA